MITGLITDGLILFDGQPIQRHPMSSNAAWATFPKKPSFIRCVMSEERMNGKIDALLDLFQLTASRHSLLSSYSKGMRQKVLISAALLDDPDLLAFDEPMQFPRSGGSGKVCSKIIILRKGELVANNSVSALGDLMSLKSLEDISLNSRKRKTQNQPPARF